MLKCEFCKEGIDYGTVFLQDGKAWHTGDYPHNCFVRQHMAEQGYPHPCPKCKCRGQEQVGWDEFWDCTVCLGRGFLAKEPINENGYWKRAK